MDIRLDFLNGDNDDGDDGGGGNRVGPPMDPSDGSSPTPWSAGTRAVSITATTATSSIIVEATSPRAGRTGTFPVFSVAAADEPESVTAKGGSSGELPKRYDLTFETVVPKGDLSCFFKL